MSMAASVCAACNFLIPKVNGKFLYDFLRSSTKQKDLGVGSVVAPPPKRRREMRNWLCIASLVLLAGCSRSSNIQSGQSPSVGYAPASTALAASPAPPTPPASDPAAAAASPADDRVAPDD